jgi:hypothetical protein
MFVEEEGAAMKLSERCDEIVRLIDETLADLRVPIETLCVPIESTSPDGEAPADPTHSRNRARPGPAPRRPDRWARFGPRGAVSP